MTLHYKVDLDELARVIESLEAFGATIDAKLAELDRVNAELHLTWEGESAVAQTEAHRKLTRGAAEVHRGLLAMHAAAERAHTSYHAAAVANQQTWKQVR
jgi:WXG100 family type VII secretion target